MATNYPSSLDTFDSIASDKKTSDVVGGRTHRDMHNDLGDALEAVQAELGTDPAGSFATVKARLAAYDAFATKTSAYTATVNDNTLDVTSGTFTLDLPAASTCTGKTLNIRNSGSGVVTLDGNSSETIDSIATYPLGQGSYVQITSSGAGWIITGGVPNTGTRQLDCDGSWTGSVRFRRVGSVVHVAPGAGNPTMPSSGTTFLASVPSGFQPIQNAIFTTRNTSSGSVSGGSVSTSLSYYGTVTNGQAIIFGFAYLTADAWPTSLPGTAV